MKYYPWMAWTKVKGTSVKNARKETIKMMETMAKKYKRDIRNPKRPGPDYYEGCFKKGKK